MEAYQAHELELGDLSRAARESYREFVPDRLDRMAMLAECPAYRRSAANCLPLALSFIRRCCNAVQLLRSNHDILTKVSERSGYSRHGLHAEQALHDREARHDPWLGKLESTSQCFRTLEIVLCEEGEFLPVAIQRGR